MAAQSRDNASMPTTVTESVDLRRTPAQVLELLADQGFVERRTAVNPSMTGRVRRHTVTSGEVHIETTAALPADWLPARVRAAAEALPTITRTERWDRASGSGTTTFDISGVPAAASAVMTLAATADGCRMTHIVRLSVSVPLVAGLIERALAGQVAAALRAEFPLYDRAEGAE